MNLFWGPRQSDWEKLLGQHCQTEGTCTYFWDQDNQTERNYCGQHCQPEDTCIYFEDQDSQAKKNYWGQRTTLPYDMNVFCGTRQSDWEELLGPKLSDWRYMYLFGEQDHQTEKNCWGQHCRTERRSDSIITVRLRKLKETIGSDYHTCDIFLDSNREIWVFR